MKKQNDTSSAKPIDDPIEDMLTQHPYIKESLEEKLRLSDVLLQNIKQQMPRLQELLKNTASGYNYEDMVYRFYHQSYKVYRLQKSTESIVCQLKDLLPERKLNSWFLHIINEGTEKTFKAAHNQDWLTHTRPILEAFFHSRYMLEMAVTYGNSLDRSPECLPSGWAAFLYLYNLR
jgi:hypothetical protein